MTQIEHILCAFCGGLFGYSIVYAWCKILDFITSKRVEIPEIKYDVTDNPILSLKNRLGQAYVASHDQTVKKLLHRLLEYVEVIDEWHKEEINDCNRTQEGLRTHCKKFSQQCDRYRAEVDELAKRCTELQSKLNESQERLKRESAKAKTLESETDKLRDMLKEKEQPDFLIEKRFPGQTDPFIKITMDEEALKQSFPMNTGAIIHIDSEDLNRYSVGRGPDGNLLKDEPTINDSEFVEKLRDIWAGLDNDMEYHQYSVTVRKYGDCNEKKIVVLARSPIDAVKLVPAGYTVESVSKLFD